MYTVDGMVLILRAGYIHTLLLSLQVQRTDNANVQPLARATYGELGMNASDGALALANTKCIIRHERPGDRTSAMPPLTACVRPHRPGTHRQGHSDGPRNGENFCFIVLVISE